MKKLLWTVIVVAAISLSVCTVVVRPQTAPQAQAELDHPRNELPRQTRQLKIKNFAFGLSKYESPNGQTLIENGAFGNTTTVATEWESKKLGKFEVEFIGNLTAPSQRHISQMYSSFGVSVTRKQKQFDFTVVGQYFRSQHFSFGITGVGLSKEYIVRKIVRLTPFGNVSYYFPTESSNNHVTPGWVLRNGVKTDFELKDMVFEFNSQMISDSGALHRGKRIGFNFEGNFLFQLPGFKAGPILGYTNFIGGESKGVYGFALQVGK